MSKIQVITGVERRRKWSETQKQEILKEAETSTISAVARKHKLPASQLFLWRKQLKYQSPITNIISRSSPMQENISHINQFNQSTTDSLQSQVKRLEQILGRKTLEMELLKEQLVSYINRPEKTGNSDPVRDNLR